METDAAEKAQEKGELDDKFTVLAEHDEGFALMQFESKLNNLVYTARRSRAGRWFKGLVPRDVFFTLAREALEKAEE